MSKVKLFIIAGEASGDVLGGKLIAQIKEQIKQNKDFKGKKLELYGVGGKNMKKAGLSSLFDMSQLSLMGFFEVLPHIPKLLKLIKQTAQEIIKVKPDIVVTIDSPDFCFRVIKKLNKSPITKKIQKVHFVAPTVWAYREKRAQKIAQLYDLLLVILPFEPPYFQKYGLKTKFIGHPITENKIEIKNNNFRKKHQIDDAQTLICLTPGSRVGEVKRILPPMIEAMTILAKKYQNLVIAIPVLPKTSNIIKELITEHDLKIILVEETEKLPLFASANIALAKSGTNTLEMAMYNLPMVITYKTNFLTYFLLKIMVKVKFVNLINLILNKEIIPELLQNDCKAKKLAHALDNLLQNPKQSALQISQSQKALKTLGLNAKENPSIKAAKEVINYFNFNR